MALFPAMAAVFSALRFRFLLLVMVSPALAGCAGPGPIEVDLTARPIRFVVDHHGWPRPFWWPRVNEFVVAAGADDSGELVWHLKSTSEAGELAHHLAFIYGRVPPRFYQIVPKDDAPAPPLKPGQVYYVAAGGKQALYRMVFSLPVESMEVLRPRPPSRRQ